VTVTNGGVVDRYARRRAAGWGAHRNPGGLLYGAVVSASVLAFAGTGEKSTRQVMATVLEVLVVYWAAHVYTRVLADRLVDPSATVVERARESLVHELPVLAGGLPALGVFTVASIVGIDTSSAADIALGATVVLLGWVGFLVGKQAGATGWSLALEVLTAAMLGVFVVGFKAALH
jgi:hypothetical protein